ncbi:hypothetical protein JL722_12424 [Aureococcus anophagefferens]|nr:hypothetical protein JL722_12424 [Aureococcus anophagefferens]
MDAPFENGEAPIEPDRPSRACAPSSAAPGARSVSIHAITWIGEKALDARRKKRFAASLRPRDVATPEHATEACKVCGLAHSDEQDALLYCDCCDGCFHQKCYHVPEIPEGDWFCRPCLKKKAKGVPPAMVPDPPGVEDDGERVAGDPDAAKAVIAARGLESNADFGVVAALMDRFGWPACKWLTARNKELWAVTFAQALRDAGYANESGWLLDAGDLEEVAPGVHVEEDEEDEEEEEEEDEDEAALRGFAEGVAVDARWRGRKAWYGGTVAAVRGNVIDVRYDDGEFEEGVPLNFVRLSLAKFRAEQKAAQEAAESTCRRKIGKLAAPRRCRLLRLAFEIALEWDAQLKSRIDGAISRADRTAPRSLVDEHTVGVDAAGRSYFVLEDDAGCVVLCRKFHPGHPATAPALVGPADPRKQPDKRKRPRAPPPPAVPPRKRKRGAPSFQVLASSALDVAAVAAELLEATHGDELWLSKVLRDELAPHILRTRRAAVNAVKKEERAARRQRAIMRDLGTVRDVGTRRAAARPVDYTGAAYDAQIKAAERAHGRYI